MERENNILDKKRLEYTVPFRLSLVQGSMSLTAFQCRLAIEFLQRYW